MPFDEVEAVDRAPGPDPREYWIRVSSGIYIASQEQRNAHRYRSEMPSIDGIRHLVQEYGFEYRDAENLISLETAMLARVLAYRRLRLDQLRDLGPQLHTDIWVDPGEGPGRIIVNRSVREFREGSVEAERPPVQSIWEHLEQD